MALPLVFTTSGSLPRTSSDCTEPTSAVFSATRTAARKAAGSKVASGLSRKA